MGIGTNNTGPCPSAPVDFRTALRRGDCLATTDRLHTLLPLIYDAAIDPDRWPDFLEALNTAVGGSAAVLHVQNTGTRQSGQVLAGVGVDLAAQQRYDAYYASRNIWTIRGRDKLVEGAVLTGEMVCPNAELERSEYYNDYLKALDFYYATAAIPSATADATMIVTTFRSKKQGTFARRSLALQRLLMPHLKRAAQVHERMVAAQVERQALRQALEALPFGVILLDAAARVVFANRMARRIAEIRDGLELTREGVAASLAAETVQLRRSIAAALLPHRLQPDRDGALRLSRPSGARPLEVLVASIGDSGPAFGHAAASAALFVADPDRARPTNVRALQTLHGLTSGEARFAAGLAAGMSVDELSEAAGVTRNTARWIVKQILHKTHTRSQAQAVALFMRGLSTLEP